MANEVLLGAFYEGHVLYLEAYDAKNHLDFRLRFVSQKPADPNKPTSSEQKRFKNDLNTAISKVRTVEGTHILKYQGPSRSQHSNGPRPNRKPIQDMSLWAEFVLDVLQNQQNVQFVQKNKSSKPKSGSTKKGSRVGINYLETLRYFVSVYIISGKHNAKSRHCFAAALDLGNAKRSYEKWAKRIEKYRLRLMNGKVTRADEVAIDQKLQKIPFS